MSFFMSRRLRSILLIFSYVQLVVLARHVKSPGSPNSSGSKTNTLSIGNKAQITGGGNATPQAPKDNAQLKAWLADDVPRVILIKTTFDFTSSQVNVSSKGCIPWAPCKNGNQNQEARNFNNWCSRFSDSHKPTEVSYHEAPLEPLVVNSQKTLLGVGSSGVLQGKGLVLHNTKNVIIRNLSIKQLNPHLVWGGDSIMLDGVSNILIEHCTFSLVGRQMIVTGGMYASEGNTNVFLMNNLFDGRTEWSARCQNRHYWNVLLSGPGDTITMGNNCFDFVSGRSPKIGGAGNPNVMVHYYNNLHTNIIGETFEIAAGSNFLAEGNVIKNAKFENPADEVTDHGGNSYIPFTDPDAQACQGYLGRPCVKNLIIQSSPYKFALKKATLQAFQKRPPTDMGPIKAASDIVNGVPGGCGVGHI